MSGTTGTGPGANSDGSADDEAARRHRRRQLILGVLGLAQLMVVLDSTIINIALPSAQRDLGFSDDDRQWIISAYALAFGSLLLVGGRLSDLFGRKWTFVAGLAGFALASALGGIAQNFGTLVGARALQGAFGALLAPAALSLLTTTFTDPDERNRAFGIFGAIAGSGAAAGLLLGGALTEYLTWRWCLFVNIAFAGAAIAGALPLLTNARPERRSPIDVPGTLTATAGLFALVYAVSRAETQGWGSMVVLVLGAVSSVLLVAFVAVQRRSSHPLLPLHVVLDRNRGGSYLAVGLASAAIFGVFLFLTFFLQETLQFSPLKNGLAFMPLAVSITVTAIVVQVKAAPRLGAKPLIVAGMVCGAIAMALLAQLSPDSTYARNVLPALIVLGLGFGLVFAPAVSSATLGVEDDDSGVASAMVDTGQQLGGSIGAALLTTIFSRSAADFIANHGGPARAAAAGAVHGYTTAFWWATAIFIIGTAVTALVMRRELPGEGRMASAGTPA